MVSRTSSGVAQQKYGTSLYYIYRQLAWAVVGFAAMLALKRLDYRRLNNQACAFAGIMVVLPLLVVVYFLDGHAHRWLRLGPVGIQPSEFAKPALNLFLAYFVTERAKKINNPRT